MSSPSVSIVVPVYGNAANLFGRAEPGKEEGGIDPAAFRDIALRSGFSVCEVPFDWFPDQGAVTHGQSFVDAGVIEAYLRRVSPLADHLFKYIFIHAVK